MSQCEFEEDGVCQCSDMNAGEECFLDENDCPCYVEA